MSESPLHHSAVDVLTSWTPFDAEQDSLRHTYLAFLAANPDACLRRSVSGHLTASAVVFDASLRFVLLTLHPRVGKWVQLGGHCEPEDPTIAAAAAREAAEESGLPDLTLTPTPVHLHTHPITCSLGVPTRHLDVQFAAIAGGRSGDALPTIVRSDESVDLRWWPVDELPDNTDHESIPVLVHHGLAAFG